MIEVTHALLAMVRWSQDCLVPRGQRVFKVFLEQQEVKEKRVLPDQLGLLEIPVRMAFKV